MRSPTCCLPNGQTFTVTPVFGGVTFKSNDMNIHHSAFPPGWTVIIYTNLDPPPPTDTTSEDPRSRATNTLDPDSTTRFTKPTLCNDSLYISYIVNPPSSDFKPASSPTRQVAMMLWATLLWYFHEPEPDLHLHHTTASSNTPLAGKPKGEWRVNIKREGIFKGRHLLQKLERMGLIASEESSVGLFPTSMEGRDGQAHGWSNMFVSRRAFWQIDPKIFLFTLSPKWGGGGGGSPSPFPSRRASPSHDGPRGADSSSSGEYGSYDATAGPFWSGSHLPTFFPPAPTQYTFTDGVRHPIRPKPPHQGEVFYIRYIPSVQQYLSFRVPVFPAGDSATSARGHSYTTSISNTPPSPQTQPSSDLEILHKWMNNPRVSSAWNSSGSLTIQEQFLRANLTSRHSFPVIGCWDGKPFGYFEIYWVKEDRLGRLLDVVDDYDRGLHVLVGEEEFRGPQRVRVWLSALVHFCWLADLRTRVVVLEPRVDNLK